MLSPRKNKTPRQFLKIIAVKNEQPDLRTLVFEKPESWGEFQPGQFLVFHPAVFLPGKIMQPILLPVASGAGDNHIEVTFPISRNMECPKNILEYYQAGHSALIDGPVYRLDEVYADTQILGSNRFLCL